MKTCGQVYAGLSIFSSLMNMSKRMATNNYDKIVSDTDVVKNVAEDERCNFNDSESINTPVSHDGSWQCREFSSLYRAPAAISMITGEKNE